MKSIYDPDYVKNLFNQMSNSYERMNYITSFGFSIRWRKQFLQKLGDSQKELNVIDCKFENSQKVKNIFEKYNLIVNIESYFGGCATGISGYKP